MVKFLYLSVSLLALIMLLSDCQQQDKLLELKQAVETIRQAAQKNIKQAHTSFQLPTPIKYQTEISNESFDTNDKIKHKTTSTNPLIDYPLSELQFLGTIAENNQSWAYILTPDNITYQVKEGDSLGSLKGKIIKISSDHIDILEIYTVIGKSPQTRIVTLRAKG